MEPKRVGKGGPPNLRPLSLWATQGVVWWALEAGRGPYPCLGLLERGKPAVESPKPPVMEMPSAPLPHQTSLCSAPWHRGALAGEVPAHLPAQLMSPINRGALQGNTETE